MWHQTPTITTMKTWAYTTKTWAYTMKTWAYTTKICIMTFTMTSTFTTRSLCCTIS